LASCFQAHSKMFFIGFLTLSLLNGIYGQAAVQHAGLVGRDLPLKQSYDFIVIGGGTSGLTVADRLTEDPSSALPENRHLRRRSTNSLHSLCTGDRVWSTERKYDLDARSWAIECRC
jgi:hypothetical protein